jgi:hypothetical protein
MKVVSAYLLVRRRRRRGALLRAALLGSVLGFAMAFPAFAHLA